MTAFALFSDSFTMRTPFCVDREATKISFERMASRHVSNDHFE